MKTQPTTKKKVKKVKPKKGEKTNIECFTQEAWEWINE